MHKINFALFLMAASLSAKDASAPQKPQSAAGPAQPQVKINYLNVCSPSEADQKELLAAMRRVPREPALAEDFEASHGRTSMENAPIARYVRLRRDFAPSSPFATAQYSLSLDSEQMVETLVLRGRDVKSLLALSFEDSTSAAVAAPSALLSSNTPTDRIKLERFGKGSIVVARCRSTQPADVPSAAPAPAVDQSALDPLFDYATELFAAYRRQIGLHSLLAGDIAWIAQGSTGNKKAAAARGHRPWKPKAKH